MVVQIVSVFDAKAEAFNLPQFVQSVGTGVRGFTDAVNDVRKETDLSRHPEDFQLFHLGTFEDSDARFELFQVPKLLVAGATVKQS